MMATDLQNSIFTRTEQYMSCVDVANAYVEVNNRRLWRTIEWCIVHCPLARVQRLGYDVAFTAVYHAELRRVHKTLFDPVSRRQSASPNVCATYRGKTFKTTLAQLHFFCIAHEHGFIDFILQHATAVKALWKEQQMRRRA